MTVLATGVLRTNEWSGQRLLDPGRVEPRHMNAKQEQLPTLVAVTLVLGLLLSCTSVRFGYLEDDKNAAVNAITHFHARLNAGQFDQIYDTAHSSLQKSQSREQLTAAMQETKNQFGRFQLVTFSEMKVIPGRPVEVRAVYNSTFEKGAATELFRFVRLDGKTAQLVQYQIFAGTVRPTH